MHLEVTTTGIVRKEDPAPNPRRDWTSASAANRDSLCAGAHLLQKGIPEPPASDEATTGRRIHAALKNSGDFTLLNSFNVNERAIFDNCRIIEKKLVLDWFGQDSPPMRVYREERLWVKFYHPNGPFAGTYEHSGEPDVIFHAGAKALILDYKTGIGEVKDASSNLQLRDLACLFRGDLMRQKQILVECAVAIVQPLATSDPVLCAYKEPDLDRAAREMMERVMRSNDPKSPRIAGEVQCKWCRATAKCPQYQTWATATLPSFRDIMSVSPEHWTPEQRTIFMDRLPIAQKWLDDTKAFLNGYASIDPNFVPGYALSNGATKSPITDLKTLLDRIVAHGGTAASLLLEAGDVTKKDLEAYFKKLIRNKIKGAIAQNKAYEELLAGICTSRPNKPTLKKV